VWTFFFLCCFFFFFFFLSKSRKCSGGIWGWKPGVLGDEVSPWSGKSPCCTPEDAPGVLLSTGWARPGRVGLGRSHPSPSRDTDACRRLFPFLRRASAQLPVWKYRGSLARGCGRIWERPAAGQVFVPMAGGAQGTAARGVGQAPVSWVGQSQQWLCQCGREGGRLWAGGTG